MTKRVFWSMFAIVLAVLVLVTTLVGGVLYSSFETQLADELAQEAQFAAQGVEDSGISYLASLPQSANRLTLVAQDGTVLFDNEADTAALGNHNDREEIVEARATGVGDSVRYSSTLGAKTIYHAVLLDDGMVLRVSTVQDSVLSLLARLVQPLVIILAIVLALAAFLAYLLARRITRPLNDIDLEHPEQCETYEELSPLLVKIHAQNRTIETQMDDLRHRQQELAQITAHMQEGLVVTDASGEVLSINRMASELFDADETRSVGRSILELDRSDALRTAIASALEGRSADASTDIAGRRYRFIASPVLEDGAVTGTVLLIIDVTERYEWEKLRSEFATNVSHELRTPLTALSGTAEIMSAGLVAPDDVPHFAQRIYEESQRLIALVNDIIEVSRLDDREAVYEREDVDLGVLAADVIGHLAPAADAKGIAVALEDGHASVEGVKRILEEMLCNLVDNAIKYTPEGGAVTVAVKAPSSGGGPTLSVSDTGIGIPAADLDRVFERFYRVDKSRSQDVAGTGLGLSIVKHAAAYHGAAVRIESAEGQGTTVSVIWP